MKFKGDFKKIRFFATIGLSAMAMVVATIGTFAWFQAKSSGADPKHEVEAGSAGVTINSVTGYRGKYLDKGNGTDYTDASITRFDMSATGLKVEDNDNAEQKTVIDQDTPSGGEGYYLVGDGNFCYDHDSSLDTAAKRTAAAYKYAYGVKMKTVDVGSNTAFIGNVYLNTSWLFDIRWHYYTTEDNEPITKDTNPATGVSGLLVAESGGHYHSTSTGWFDIYLNSSKQVYLRSTESANNTTPKVNTARSKVGPTIKKATTSSTTGYISIWLVDKPGWSSYGHDWYIHIWGASFDTTHSTITSTSSAKTNDTTNTANWGTVGDDGGVSISADQIIDNYKDGNKNYRAYKFLFPWYITGFSYKYRKPADSYWMPDSCTQTISGSKARVDWFEADPKVTPVDNAQGTSRSFTAYTITYDYTNGGSGAASAVFKAFEKTTAPDNPTKTGYEFVKWTETNSASASPYAFGSALTADKSLYAQWSPQSVTINYDQQGYSTIGTTSQNATYGAAMPSITRPQKTNYEFGGYFTEKYGKGTKYYNADGSSARNCDKTTTTTLYAYWTPVTSSGTELYVMNNRTEWAKTLIRIWFGSDETNWYQEEWLQDGAHSSGGPFTNVYKVRIPANAAKFLFYTGTYSNPTQTRGITSSTNPAWQDSFVTGNPSLATYDMIVIQNGREGSGDGKCYCRWGKYQSAAPAKGYYLVGGSSGLGGASAWTFGSGTKMTHEGVGQNGSDGVNKAELLRHEITVSESQAYFQIWAYNGSKWIQYESGYGGSSETYCCDMKMTASGSYSIYINSSDVITVSGGNAAIDATVRVKFFKYQGGGANDVKMEDCDSGSNNLYAIEAPVTVKAGDTFYIEKRVGSTTTNYGANDSYSALTIADVASTYLKKGDSFTISEGGNSRTYYKYEFKVAGQFTFYYTNEPKLSVAPIPELGYGYYILINQGGTSGTNLPVFSYSKCVKMKTVNAAGATNKANYFRFYAKENDLLAFRSYVADVDKYYTNDNIYNVGPAVVGTSTSPVRKVNLTDGSDTAERRSVNSHAVKIMTTGYYNVFINSSNQVHIALDSSVTASSFFKLNSIPTTETTHTKVRNANTSLILKVSFNLTSAFDSNIFIDVAASANDGLASQLIYAVSSVDPTLGTDSPYDYMRKQVYGSLTENVASVSASDLDGGTHVAIQAGNDATAAGNHVIYILIDYKAASVKDLDANPTCDYYLSLRASQA